MMETEMMFHILGIGETTDEKAIVMAYRNLLKNTNPEDDPEGFKRLREAYESALTWARQPQKDQEEETEKTEVDVWIDRVDEVYLDIRRRYLTKEWERLLADPVCEELDTSLEARNQLLVYLMDHIHLPWAIWRLIDRTFDLVTDLEELKEHFPKNFLNYVNYYVEHEGFIRFELFRVLDESHMNADAYLDHYLETKRKIDRQEEDANECLKELADLQAFGLYLPYEDVERMRLYTGLAKQEAGQAEEFLDRAGEIADRLLNEYPDDIYIAVYCGYTKWEAGEKEAAKSLWSDILDGHPDHYQAKRGMVLYHMDRGESYEARELMLDLVDIDGQDEEILKYLTTVNDLLIVEYKGKLERGEEDAHLCQQELELELGWCLFQNERADEAVTLLKDFKPDPDQEYSYCNLYGRLLYHTKHFGEALPLLNRWLELIQSTPDDGDAEHTKRRSRLGRAYYILGGCYFEMGRQEEAEKYVGLAIEEAGDANERLGCMQYLAHILTETKQYEKCVDVCDQIIAKDENYYPAYLARQEACYELHKAQEVVDDYHRAVDIFPGYYKPYLLAAQVFFYYNQFEDAKGVIDKAKENNVEFSQLMKLFEVKILRNLAENQEDRKEPHRLIEELKHEVHDETDITDLSEVEFETGLLYWDDDNCTEALKHLTLAIGQNSERMQYRMVRGHIYLDLERYDEALRDYEAAEDTYSDSPSLFYNKGVCYEMKKMKVLAVENYQKCLECQNGYRDACEKVGDYYRDQYEEHYRSEDFDKAIEYIGRQLAVSENCYYLVHRGLMYMYHYDLFLAIEDFEKALTLSPTDWAAFNNLGCCYKYLGSYDKAITYFKKAAEHMADKKSMLPYSNMADCYEARGEYEEAIECYRKDLELFPDHTEFWREIGNLYSYIGSYDEALKAYAHTKSLDDYYENMGLLYYRQGKEMKAVGMFKSAFRKAPPDKKAARYNDMGDFYLEDMRRYDKSVSCYKRSVELAEDQSDLFYYEEDLAKAYFLTGNRELAKEHAELAMEHFKSLQRTEEDYVAYPSYGPARMGTMGWIAICLGDTKKGMKYFEDMDKGYRCRTCRHKECFEKHLFQGEYYEAIGEYELAINEYQKALEYNTHLIGIDTLIHNLEKRMEKRT